ncbi:hypothetical protein FQR65_LT17902 [Abscondita terminalis]|nr:hypothetical protein FQR65_LT17902 [Abscondita terminalis]
MCRKHTLSILEGSETEMTTNNVSIEDVPLNRFHQLLTIRTGGGWLLDGYVLSIVGVAMVQLSSALQLTSFWQGMIAASALIGIFFGSFLGGWLGGLIGRQKLYFVAPILFTLCSLTQYWVESAMMLFLCRFVIGIGVGFEYTIAGSLLAEFLPQQSSRTSSGRFDHFMVYAWRLVLASPAVIGILLIILRLGTPESPRWLLSKGRTAEADAIIKKVYGPTFSLNNLQSQILEKKISFSSFLTSGYGARVFFVSMFWACSVIPVFAVYAFAPKVLDALHLKGDWAAYGSVAITLLFVVGCVLATRLINHMGRRKASPILILVLFGLYALFIGGAQVLQFVYPNELFPTQIRPIGVGIGAAFSRIGAAIGTWLVPMSLDSIGIGNTMYVAAGVTLLGLVVSLAFAPETRGMSLEQSTTLN